MDQQLSMGNGLTGYQSKMDLFTIRVKRAYWASGQNESTSH